MPDPFITEQDLTDYIGQDVTADAGATIAVASACEICRNIAEQAFNLDRTTVVLDGTDTDMLLLPDRPVQTAVAVTVGGSAIDDFISTEDGRLIRGTVGGDQTLTWPRGRQNISITYDHGYETIPTDVKMVALQVAARIVIQGVAKREQQGDLQVEYATPTLDLTSNEDRILRRYRRARSF